MNRRSVAWLGTMVIIVIAATTVFLKMKPSNLQLEPELVVASIIPLTGTAAEFGGYHREAAELVVDEYNTSHKGIRRLRHVFQDSKSSPKDGVSAGQAILFGAKPVALQVQLSGVSMAVAPIVAEKNIILLTVAGTGGPKDINPYAFRNYPAPEMTAEETARVFLADNTNAKVAILRNNDEFGISVAEAFKRRLDLMKIRVVADDTFEKTATDFRAAVTKVLGSSPNTVYLIGFGNPLGRIIVQLRELGYEGDILGGPELAFADVLGVAKDAAEGVRFLDLAFNADSQLEPTRSFVQSYRSRYSRTPTAVSAVVYDGWSLTLEAIDRAGSSDPQRIRDELLRVTNHMGVCGLLSVSPDRDIVYPLAPRTVKNGKTVLLSSPAGK